jgi:hypothetical protein
MFYRIVLQGRATADHDLATVKREFARVTGLPENVSERLFAEAPQSLKDNLTQADAERIAATLRAIGAAVTIERDLLASLDSADGGVRELQAPDHRGPPTIVPGSEAAPTPASAPPTRVQRMLRRSRPYLAFAVGTPIAVVLLLVLGPHASDAFRALRPARTATAEPVKRLPAEPPPPPAPPSASALHGPWRCTDQRTGLAVYWTYGADGALTFHGDTIKEGAARPGDPSVPSGWQLEGNRLAFTFAQRPPVAYTVSDLSLMRLRYGDGRDVDIQCRRP